MMHVTLVAGGEADVRERAIAGRFRDESQPEASRAVILEGMNETDIVFDANVQVIRLAPACPCCTGNLAMRVTLNRLLRHPPQQLFISVAQAAHLDAIRRFLTEASYDAHLTLTENWIV